MMIKCTGRNFPNVIGNMPIISIEGTTRNIGCLCEI